MDYINGNKFAEIAGIVIDFDYPTIDFDLSSDAIIFCKTDFLARLFDYIKYSESKYILITHMSDRSINKGRFERKPNCVKKWFAENTTYNHRDLIPIPLGLENHTGKSKGKFTDHEWFVDNIVKLREVYKDNRLYCNWKQDTNRSERMGVLRELQNSDLDTCIERDLLFREYCGNMAQHKFVICPSGNGIDTHRIWESLYIGCYPIVIKHGIYEGYDLPILQVESYAKINSGLLKVFLEKEHSYRMMNMSFWANKITEEFCKL